MKNRIDSTDKSVTTMKELKDRRLDLVKESRMQIAERHAETLKVLGLSQSLIWNRS
jgi:hypothetical protein